jgi:hypothetical protein
MAKGSTKRNYRLGAKLGGIRRCMNADSTQQIVTEERMARNTVIPIYSLPELRQRPT